MFSDRYIELCAARGTHVTTVAEELGFSRSAGLKWANGSVPRKTTLRKIGDYFGVSVEYLLGDDTKKAPTENGERSNDKLSMLVSLFERLPPEEQNDVIFQLLSKAQAQLDQDSRK